MQDDLVNAVMKEVMKRVGSDSADEPNPSAESRDDTLPMEELVQLTEYGGQPG